MKRITEVTRRDIFDILKDRYGNEMENYVYQHNYSSWNNEAEKVFHFYGRIDADEFLGMLYEIEKLPSEHGNSNAKEDVLKHFVLNKDYDEYWIFDDARFELKNGTDKRFLLFLCKMFHPYVRNEKSAWRDVLTEINNIVLHDGFELYEESRISGREVYGWKDISTKNSVVQKQSESLSLKFNSEYMTVQINSMNNTIETNPQDAIGKAKELYESCCKIILIENNVSINPKWKVSHLSKEVLKVLKLVPEDISDTAKASETIKQLLGNLSAISQCMSELRNSYGSGHGKDSKFKGLGPRHARLAVGSAVTAIHFIWETYEERNK